MSSRDIIRFVLDGEVVELSDVDPTRTVLQFLREDLGRTGTKEGCAEGDCGACTVVLAELSRNDEDLTLKAINSCIQFLPTLDGKELITVESLGRDGELHPVQKAMVDCHGSQCGFCTPGFVMSLYALYETNANPSRRDIDDALAGNLCRCTGYIPIIAAARRMYEERPPEVDTAARCKNLDSLARDESLEIEWQGRKFFAPRSIDELATFCDGYPDATLLAGGTDVGLWVTKQHRELDTIIYTGNVAELGIVSTTDTHIEIGAAVSLTDAMPAILEHYPSLEELFLRFASPPIRNAGTLGGNVANGSPIGDSMPALLVLDALTLLRKGGAERSIPLADFYTGYRQTVLRPGEFLEKILIPLPRVNEKIASYKVSKRFDQDISAVCGAYRIILDGDKVVDARIAYGGMAEVPKRAKKCERALSSRPWSELNVEVAMAALDKDFKPIDDMRASAGYRRHVCKNLLKRFYLETRGGDETRVYAYGR